MYLHLGNDVIIREEEIIGVFDLDNTTVSSISRKFLSDAEKKKQVINVSNDLPKSFVVCAKRKRENKIYLSQLSSTTLLKRAGNFEEMQIS